MRQIAAAAIEVYGISITISNLPFTGSHLFYLKMGCCEDSERFLAIEWFSRFNACNRFDDVNEELSFLTSRSFTRFTITLALLACLRIVPGGNEIMNRTMKLTKISRYIQVS